MKKSLFFLLAIIIFAGCTQKNNPVGYDPIEEPRYLELSEGIISNVYSYEDTVKSYRNATVLSLGNRNKYRSQLLFKFYILPDSLYEIENEEINLKLVVHKQRNSETNLIRIGKIKQTWNQDHVSWKSATDSLEWEYPYFEETDYEINIDGTFSENDTVNIQLPFELFYKQEGDLFFADSLVYNYGITFDRDTSSDTGENIIEFHSSESGEEYSPELSFNYKPSADEEYTEWSSSLVSDGMLYNSSEDDLEEFEVYADSLIFRNISPTKMFIGLDIGLEDFIAAGDSSGITTMEDFNRLTVNKAELVLHAYEGSYFSNDEIYAIPYLLTDSLWIQTPEQNSVPIYKEQFFYVSGTSATSDSLTSETFRLDVTEVVQSYITTDDEYDGYGIIVVSGRENRDFSYVKFYNQMAEEEKRPTLELIYTPPLLP